MSKYECDFSEISDGEIITASQLLEASFKPDALEHQHVDLPLLTDIFHDELLMSLTMKIVGHYTNWFVQV